MHPQSDGLRRSPTRPCAFLTAALVALALVALGPAARADPVRIGLLTHGSCLGGSDDVLPRLRSLLEERGYQVTIVGEGPAASELDAYNVVVLGAGPFLCDWNWGLDDELAEFVRQGGGLVATGWVAYYLAENPRGEHYPGLESVLPVLPGTQYDTEPRDAALEGHPITAGVDAFVADYNSVGGGLRERATPLLLNGEGMVVAAAWTVGDGRVVFLGPNYLGSWEYYDNERLLDGSQPDAVRLLLQAVDWAGRER